MPFWIPLLDSMMDVILDSILDVILDTTSVFQLLHPTFGFYVGVRFGFHLWVPSWIPRLDPALGFWLWIPSLDSMLDPTVDSKLQGNAGATPGQRRGHGGATAGQPFGARPGNRPLTIL